MKPSDREDANADFLTGSFVTIPYVWMSRFAEVGLQPTECIVLLQIFAAAQVEHQDFLTPQELATLCGMSAHDVAHHIQSLVSRGYLNIGERLDEYGTHSNYFDLKPLWTKLRGRDPQRTPVREWRKDPFTHFEEEFGRPLSNLEYEQIRQWLERDGHPEWLIIEGLREAVLANKYSIRYIDRILYDWQRNRVRTKAELEAYRESYRERQKARDEAAAGHPRSAVRKQSKQEEKDTKDDRYSAFYQLYPDA